MAILETNPTIFLIFCIRLAMTDLRTNPYWRFSEFLTDVDFLAFFGAKMTFFRKIGSFSYQSPFSSTQLD